MSEAADVQQPALGASMQSPVLLQHSAHKRQHPTTALSRLAKLARLSPGLQHSPRLCRQFVASPVASPTPINQLGVRQQALSASVSKPASGDKQRLAEVGASDQKPTTAQHPASDPVHSVELARHPGEASHVGSRAGAVMGTQDGAQLCLGNGPTNSPAAQAADGGYEPDTAAPTATQSVEQFGTEAEGAKHLKDAEPSMSSVAGIAANLVSPSVHSLCLEPPQAQPAAAAKTEGTKQKDEHSIAAAQAGQPASLVQLPTAAALSRTAAASCNELTLVPEPGTADALQTDSACHTQAACGLQHASETSKQQPKFAFSGFTTGSSSRPVGLSARGQAAARQMFAAPELAAPDAGSHSDRGMHNARTIEAQKGEPPSLRPIPAAELIDESPTVPAAAQSNDTGADSAGMHHAEQPACAGFAWGAGNRPARISPEAQERARQRLQDPEQAGHAPSADAGLSPTDLSQAQLPETVNSGFTHGSGNKPVQVSAAARQAAAAGLLSHEHHQQQQQQQASHAAGASRPQAVSTGFTLGKKPAQMSAAAQAAGQGLFSPEHQQLPVTKHSSGGRKPEAAYTGFTRGSGNKPVQVSAAGQAAAKGMFSPEQQQLPVSKHATGGKEAEAVSTGFMRGNKPVQVSAAGRAAANGLFDCEQQQQGVRHAADVAQQAASPVPSHQYHSKHDAGVATAVCIPASALHVYKSQPAQLPLKPKYNKAGYSDRQL